MGKKAKLWGSLLIALIAITIIRVALSGGSAQQFAVMLFCNLLFWWFLIMFIVRLFKPNSGPVTEEDRFLETVGKIISDWDNVVATMSGVSEEEMAVLKNASPKVFEGKLIIVAANKAEYNQINNMTLIMNIQSNFALKNKKEIPIEFAYFDENNQICQTGK